MVSRATSTAGREPATGSLPESPWQAGGDVATTERRTIGDFAHQVRWLVYEAYPDIPVPRLVPGTLDTHRKASRYQTFPVGEEQRIARRLEFHNTPRSAGETKLKPASTGASPPRMLGENSIGSILPFLA